jgi:hypothetical protein
VDRVALENAIRASPRFRLVDGFVCLKGEESLLARSRERVSANRFVNGRAKAVAASFATELVRVCPFVRCVALSGSVASGGYVPSDDIDLDLFVPNGTKYLTYAVALGLGFVFALRHWHGDRFRKLICVNVIWTSRQTTPFARTDASLAFELLHCRPLIGSRHFREIVGRNSWIRSYFPQIGTDVLPDVERPRPSLFGRILGWIAERPKLLSAAERIGRSASFAIYVTAHWMHRRDRAAMERLEFLKRVKYPYEVFQD